MWDEENGEKKVREDGPGVGQADKRGKAARPDEVGGFRARADWNDNGRSLLSFSDDPEQDFFLEERYQLDVNASQKISDNLTGFVEFVNLTNEPNLEFKDGRSQGNKEEREEGAERGGGKGKF